MHTRGSGFFDFAYTCLTMGNLLIALLFFTAPSKAMRVSSAIIAFVLFIDVVLIVTVGRLRWEEGWVGIASVVWAFIVAVWCVLTDRVVAWGKREEEQRLTGRAETRRTVREWLSVTVGTIVLIGFIAITVLMTGTLILRARDATLEMSGQRYQVDGSKYEVHFNCVGNSTGKSSGKTKPTVLIESGGHPLEYDFEHWVYNAWSNGTIDRYCYWDRPGYAWSDNAPSPHSAGMSATALSETLALAGEEGPWILVSAGYGSIVSRIFSSMHASMVVGILLVEPLHEDLLHRLGAPGQGFTTWGWGIISPLGLDRIPGAIFNGRTREDRVYGAVASQSGKLLKAHLQENLVADSLTKNDISAARTIQDRKTPLAVVSSGIRIKTDRDWERKQEDMTTITDKLLSWSVVKNAPHQVWRTFEGREALESSLHKLVKAA
jgi:pimeloyl-ACP methyl ester carboxylesterase